MKLHAFMYRQGTMTLMSTVMPAGVLRDAYIIPHFGEVPNGYQRPELPKHVRQIKKYLLEREDYPILPTALVLGADEETINITKVRDSGSGVSEVEFSIPRKRIFRIIDGQHRLRGLEEAMKEDPSFAAYPLPVNILLLGPDSASTEIDTFVDINSKAKRIKTDLAILAKHQLELEGRSGKANYVEYICTEVGYLVNAELDSVWTDGIVVDPLEPIGLISISAWNRSIHRIVMHRLVQEYGDHETYSVNKCHSIASWVSSLILETWRLVEERWPDCFRTLDDDIEGPRFDPDYVIQRPIGVSAIHLYLTDLLKAHSGAVGLHGLVLKNLRVALDSSPITSYDWRVGATFSGLTSQSGFKRVMDGVFPFTR